MQDRGIARANVNSGPVVPQRQAAQGFSLDQIPLPARVLGSIMICILVLTLMGSALGGTRTEGLVKGDEQAPKGPATSGGQGQTGTLPPIIILPAPTPVVTAVAEPTGYTLIEVANISHGYVTVQVFASNGSEIQSERVEAGETGTYSIPKGSRWRVRAADGRLLREFQANQDLTTIIYP